MTFPVNFLYLGGDKCGSSWVYHVLSKHPDVTLAKAKELFYFDRFYSMGADWYLRQFPKEPLTIRMGEICHDYLYSREALDRIARDLPQDSRFLITVREPVARTVSHYKYLRKIGRTNLPFDEALKAHPQIVEHSMFGKYVRLAQDILGKDRVHVLSFEALQTDPVAFGQDLSEALGVRYVADLPYTDRVLEAQESRNPSLVRLLRNAGWVLRSLGAPRLVNRVKNSPLVSRVLYVPPGEQRRAVEIPVETRAELVKRFAEDQALLRVLTEPTPVDA
ncbi:hypothetical protein E4Z66_16625 [Aliishimia ponticola]|uniref:Sulfotransferase domain-containing protein n=1 Tax=Aliishimia ponticola TaxID=2499833 RepID=A0A4S4N8A5_9RHOB|nr:sulfotransferase [Aliishimia ponticola]THH35434.1 hypothetical protein E4Z66_16625 [Aliishimia ponticola]